MKRIILAGLLGFFLHPSTGRDQGAVASAPVERTRASGGGDRGHALAAARRTTAAPTIDPGADAAVRQALVTRVRAEIAAGAYDSPEKVDAVVTRLLTELV